MKPACAGSSVGVSIAHGLEDALRKAHALIEEVRGLTTSHTLFTVVVRHLILVMCGAPILAMKSHLKEGGY